MFKKDEKKREEDVKQDSNESEKKVDASEEKASNPVEGEPSADAEMSQSSQTSQSSQNPEPPDPAPKEPDWKMLYAVTLADFDNYKKRAARDREDVYRFAESDILKDVLPAIDNLQLALDAAKDKADDPFVKGVQLVYDTLLKALKDHGAEPFDAVGKPLDTEKMEAIATLPSDDVAEGEVSIESKKGWMLKDKVLRAAQVVVSSGKPA